jgi:hypothetical protein
MEGVECTLLTWASHFSLPYTTEYGLGNFTWTPSLKENWEVWAKRDQASDFAMYSRALRTICSFLNTWLDKFPEDFCQSTDLLNLKNLRTYVSLNMPSSDLAVRVQFLLKELEDIEPTDADPNGKMT